MPYYAPATSHPLIPDEVVQQLRHLAGCGRDGQPPCRITAEMRTGSWMDPGAVPSLWIFHNREGIEFPLTGFQDPEVDIWNDCVLKPWAARAASLHPDDA